MADLALLYQFGKGPDGVLDGGVPVDPVLVVQVDVSVARRFSDPSTAIRMFSGLLSRPSPPVCEMNPNFDASTTWSRRPLRALATNSSLVKGP